MRSAVCRSLCPRSPPRRLISASRRSTTRAGSDSFGVGTASVAAVFSVVAGGNGPRTTACPRSRRSRFSTTTSRRGAVSRGGAAAAAAVVGGARSGARARRRRRAAAGGGRPSRTRAVLRRRRGGPSVVVVSATVVAVVASARPRRPSRSSRGRRSPRGLRRRRSSSWRTSRTSGSLLLCGCLNGVLCVSPTQPSAPKATPALERSIVSSTRSVRGKQRGIEHKPS